MSSRDALHLIAAFALLLSGVTSPFLAEAEEAGTTAEERSDWQRKKCDVYRQAFAEILDHVGREGVSPAFIAKNEAFIESGCLADVDACPQTKADIEVANGLTIASMNAGAASSFSPFRCRQ
ncbi:hypothetical protein D4A92_13000 [Rhizobium rosettiformans]|uniref:DUF1311 domain-containing protein n=1 Tax=Rhizobium rosettiformans TaxID=1368430 RepID=A0ABX7EWA8_9HYPH|nr:hypothetical protein [Rhizobium rosettiformans]QRF52286.1 hypothetical protein D4A92_13000 [Rhizobium rosettiformans]